MPAMIEKMAHFGAVPWHGQSNELTDPYNIETSIIESGLDWRVKLVATYCMAGNELCKTGYNAVVRQSDNKVLSVAGPGWHPLQNAKAFDFFKPWLESGSASIEACGSLEGGLRVWVLAKIAMETQEIRPGDNIAAYILLSNAHRQGFAVRVGFTPIRVVCRNTLQMAHEASKLIRVFHNRAMTTNLANIRDTMDLASQTFAATSAQYRKLAAKGISNADVRKYVREVFQTEKDTRTVEDVIRRYLLDPAAGSVWGAYNGVTEYLSWNGKPESRTKGAWFGPRVQTGARALELALAI